MEFRYIAVTSRGMTRRGTLEAGSRDEAIQRLRQRSLSILSISLVKRGVFGAAETVSSFGRVSSIDKLLFIRHLAIMLRSGLSLGEALAIVGEQTSSKRFQSVIAQLIHDVSNGMTLSGAMARHARVFTSIMIGMIDIGESSGTLEENLDYIATELEKDYELRRKVRSAMLYPVIVLSATLALGVGLSIFILPRLVQLFSTFRVELPGTTAVFLRIANFLIEYGWYVLGVCVVCIIAWRVTARLGPVRRVLDIVYIHLPVFSHLIINAQLARITRVLSLLLKSGITINESLVITGKAIENSLYREQLIAAKEGVQKGQALATMLGNERYFPKMASRMVSVGERTGKLDESLGYLASFYEDEVDNATKNLSTILEPALLLFIGLVLGFLAVAIISPIYQFTGSLQP